MFSGAVWGPVKNRRLAWSEATSSRSRHVALLLVFHVLVWTCAFGLGRSNLDTPGDMVEAFAWGQGWQWGYWKHPPLMAWASGAWFWLMPRTDLSYALLASLNAAIGLLGVGAMAREFLDRRWVFPCMAAAALTPGLTVLAMRFNANAVLVSTWPWAIACFALAMRTGRTRHAVAAGLICGLALLAKYFSAVLITSLVLAALLHAPWRRRLLSQCGLTMLATGMLVLLPHLWWLATHDAPPFRYAAAATGYTDVPPVSRALSFIGLTLAFLAMSLAMVWHTTRERPASEARAPRRLQRIVGSVLKPSTDPLWVIALGPVLLTALITVLTAARTEAKWGLTLAFAMVLLAARGAASVPGRPSYRRAWGWLISAWLVVLCLAPLLWEHRANRDEPGQSEPRAELTELMESQWFNAYGVPLKWVAGTRPIAMSASFYSKVGAQYWNPWASQLDAPWVDAARVQRDGLAIVCDAGLEPGCQAQAEHLCGPARTLTVAKHARGHRFAPHSFIVTFCAPASYAHTRP